MKLDTTTTQFIYNAVKTAQLIDIDGIIIESGSVRALNEKKTIAIIQSTGVPVFSFGMMAINRIPTFLARYDLVKTQDGFEVSVNSYTDPKTDETYVKSFTFQAKKMKMEYRCASPSMLSLAPRKINDKLSFQIELNAEAVMLLQKAMNAYNADMITIESNDEGVSFMLHDVSNDTYKHTFAGKPKCIGTNNNMKFAHQYMAKNILTLFKYNPEGTILIGNKGILNVDVNGLGVYVIPLTE